MNNEQNVNTLLKLKMILIEEKVMLKQYPDNCSPGENCPLPPPPPIRVGVSVKVRVSFRVGRQPDNCPGRKLPPR